MILILEYSLEQELEQLLPAFPTSLPQKQVAKIKCFQLKGPAK